MQPELEAAERQLLAGLDDRELKQLTKALRTMLRNVATPNSVEPPSTPTPRMP